MPKAFPRTIQQRISQENSGCNSASKWEESECESTYAFIAQFSLVSQTATIAARVIAFYNSSSHHNWVSLDFASKLTYQFEDKRRTHCVECKEYSFALGEIELEWSCNGLGTYTLRDRFLIAPDGKFNVLFGREDGVNSLPLRLYKLGRVFQDGSPKGMQIEKRSLFESYELESMILQRLIEESFFIELGRINQDSANYMVNENDISLTEVAADLETDISQIGATGNLDPQISKPRDSSEIWSELTTYRNPNAQKSIPESYTSGESEMTRDCRSEVYVKQPQSMTSTAPTSISDSVFLYKRRNSLSSQDNQTHLSWVVQNRTTNVNPLPLERHTANLENGYKSPPEPLISKKASESDRSSSDSDINGKSNGPKTEVYKTLSDSTSLTTLEPEQQGRPIADAFEDVEKVSKIIDSPLSIEPEAQGQQDTNPLCLDNTPSIHRWLQTIPRSERVAMLLAVDETTRTMKSKGKDEEQRKDADQYWTWCFQQNDYYHDDADGTRVWYHFPR